MTMSPNSSATPPRLAAQLSYAASRVPFFQGVQAKRSTPTVRIGEIPITTKEQIRADYESFITDDVGDLRADILVSLRRPRKPHEIFSEEITENGVYISETSGSSGVPFRCAKSLADRVKLGAGTWHQRATIDERVSPNLLYPFIHQSTQRAAAIGAPSARSNDPEELRRLYLDVARSKSRWIHAPAHMILKHRSILDRHGWRPELPDLKYVECNGHFLTPDDKATIADYLGAAVLDQYGLMETWVVALSCPHGNYFTNSRNVFVEIVDDQGQGLPLSSPGRVVVTSLQAKLMPFIRYMTGDFGMFVDRRCKCQPEGTPIEIVPGRESEFIDGFEPRLAGNVLFQNALNKTYKTLGSCGVTYARIVQVGIDQFVLHTNEVEDAVGFRDTVATEAMSMLGRRIELGIRPLTASEISISEQQKPWLFRKALEGSR